MTKTELQSALAEATQTDKKTAGVFLDTLSAVAYKEIKKNGEFVCPALASWSNHRGTVPDDHPVKAWREAFWRALQEYGRHVLMRRGRSGGPALPPRLFYR